MSIWYCETHGVTGPGGRLPGICDQCGGRMSLAEIKEEFTATVTVDTAGEVRHVTDARVAAERARCAKIVQAQIDLLDGIPNTESGVKGVLFSVAVLKLKGLLLTMRDQIEQPEPVHAQDNTETELP